MAQSRQHDALWRHDCGISKTAGQAGCLRETRRSLGNGAPLDTGCLIARIDDILVHLGLDACSIQARLTRKIGRLRLSCQNLKTEIHATPRALHLILSPEQNKRLQGP